MLALQLLFAFPDSTEKFLHAASHLFGAVDGEGELRNVADSPCGREAGSGCRRGRFSNLQEWRLLLPHVAIDGDEDACGFAAGVEDDIGDVAGRDAGVG